MGKVQFDQADYSAAKESFSKAIQLNGKYAFAYNNRAAVYQKEEEYELSIKDLNEAIKLDSKYTEAYFNRGSAKQSLKDDIGACEDFNKARQLGYQKIDPDLCK